MSIREIIEHYCGDINSNNKACCAIHGEATPSLHVYEDSYWCYGACNDGGDAAKFIMEMENCSFPKAVQIYESLTCDTERYKREEVFNWEDLVGKEFNDEVHAKIKASTGVDSKGYRGIRSDTSKPFGVRYEYNEEDGSVSATYYPCTKEGKLTGYKVRKHPKDFTSPYGETGKDCDLFMQFKFETFSDTVVIVGGEIDALSLYQTLLDNQKNKQYNPIAVVSPTIGESGACKQVQAQYKFFSQFKKIIVALDNDAAGRAASEKVCKVLPRGKVHIMKLRYKDPNEYLQNGKQQELVNDFWAAVPWTPSGVHASSTLYDAALNYTSVERLSLPPFMSKVADMFGGGWVKNELSVIFAQTSQGKSLYVDSCVTHWVMNEPKEVVGVMSLEATKDKYATNIISRYLGVNLNSMQGQDRLDYLNREDIKAKIKEFLVDAEGKDRFYVYDSRGAGIEETKASILEMIIQLGVTILVADPYSDLMAGMSLEEQESFVAWLKKLILEYPQLSVVLICHTRKLASGQAGSLTESDIIGSSTVMKSAAQTISIERDKLHENPILRNVSKVTVHKNRHSSSTGLACEVYFDYKTGLLYEWEEYQRNNPEILEGIISDD